VDTVANVLIARAPTRWPGAVSALVTDIVTGPSRRARVIGVFPTVVYLGLDPVTGPAGASRTRAEVNALPTPRRAQVRTEVLPLLAVDALALPTGIRLGLPSHELQWRVQPGDHATVGEGRIELRAVRVDAVRTWSPARVPTASGGSRAVRLDSSSPLRDRAADVVRDPSSARSMVGLGTGLTPSGDDALCGVLLALRAAGSGRLGSVRDAVAAHVGRTTSLSASLLRTATEGYAVPCVVRLASALAGGDLPGAETALPEVLAIGHSSGSDLVAGLCGALDALDDPVLAGASR
jgi:Protein of unknown function (DUF2877)